MNSSSTLDARLEQRLTKSKVLSEDQLLLVHRHSKDSSLSLAEAIVQLDLLSAHEMDRIVSGLQEARFVKLEDIQIDPESVKHVPSLVARKHLCIPIRRSGSTLVVAMSDPADVKAQDALRAVTDLEIVIMQADFDALEHALFIYYGADENCGDKRPFASMRQGSQNCSWTLASPWDCSFDSFIAHDGSQRARELAKVVASGKWDSLTEPILFVGPEMCGKSHLLKSIHAYSIVRDPLLRGLYCTGQDLKARYAEFLLAGQMQTFRFELRDRELLLLDDLASAWGNPDLEAEIATAIHHVNAQGGVVVVALTTEQFVSGPTSKPLREILARGSEVRMMSPVGNALRSVLDAKCGEERGSQIFTEVADRQFDERTWSKVQIESVGQSGEWQSKR